MDTLDIRILDALQKDARLSNADLAEVVGLSGSQCSRRRMALEAAGVIAGYHAVLDTTHLGLDLLVFVEVTLHAHSDESARDFARLIEGMEEVQDAFALTGSTDYLLKLRTTDLAALNALTKRILAHQSVARIHSSVVLERLKETGRLPLRAAKI